MILAEEIACKPATPYAESALTFYCTAPTPPDVWAATAAWASVLVTIVMAIFAWRAWRTSQKALEASREQLAMTRDIELRKERGADLSAFNAALTEVCSVDKDHKPEDIERQWGQLLAAATRWGSTYSDDLSWLMMALASVLQGGKYEALGYYSPSRLVSKDEEPITELEMRNNQNQLYSLQWEISVGAVGVHAGTLSVEEFKDICNKSIVDLQSIYKREKQNPSTSS